MPRTVSFMLAVLALATFTLVRPTATAARTRHHHSGHQTSGAGAPYPASHLLSGINWDKSTYRNAGAGGDMWSTTTAPGGVVYTAWGDGVIGCPGKVSYGVA